ncbi:uncharacterized protein C8Q71DRAFT_302253 [Rhodofomes roseus]|uniref:Cytochrome P450 n=1 Tax=Rhodofomes roseus TaxID=34475 RepID=A0ABQ8K3I1_9APHY|nr:uncharacterized protein C8Q71DRAFT_302253 [Rhodofomes roseus]KAH9831402.1 hypothetical protein C8Q71DRAFT_302253 [Rhodofomes roseus]
MVCGCTVGVLTFIFRATADRMLPLSQPVNTLDGRTRSKVFVPEGTKTLIGVYKSNASKKFWGPDALEWKPQRWTQLPPTVAEAHIPGVYSHLLSFIAGKRACIGFKVSEMEMRVALAVIVTIIIFDLPENPFTWNVAAVWDPIVGRESVKPEMPLRFSMYAAQ